VLDFIINILYALVALGLMGGMLGLLLSLTAEGEKEKNIPSPLEKSYPLPLHYKDGLYPQVHCKGGEGKAKYVFLYRGLDDCTALYQLFKGNKLCKYACLEMGSCVRVCPTGAIHRDPGGTMVVDPAVCTDCGLCSSVCPTGVLRYIPRSADYYVACNSVDEGTTTLANCAVGCTGCRICERRSVEGGFFIERHLARINYSRQGERHHAAEDCPTKCIVKHEFKS
jgi:electron transport complex protein RnfB